MYSTSKQIFPSNSQHLLNTSVKPIYKLDSFKDYLQKKFKNKNIAYNLKKASMDYYCENLKTKGIVTSCEAPGNDHPFPTGTKY